MYFLEHKKSLTVEKYQVSQISPIDLLCKKIQK